MVKTFLIGRTQTIILECQSSEEFAVTSGVTQGSVLVPCFAVLSENIQSQIRLFADDTAVYLAVVKQNNPKLQDDLDQRAMVHGIQPK